MPESERAKASFSSELEDEDVEPPGDKMLADSLRDLHPDAIHRAHFLDTVHVF